MSAFDYTSGNPANLVGGQSASMVDIQGPFTDLKAFLNQRIAAVPTLVSSLPASPVDGQEIYYLADATNGVVWHLRYRAASASAYKWETVGQPPPLLSSVDTSESTGSVTYTTLGLAPNVTAPLAGDYDIEHGGWLNHNNAGLHAYQSISIASVTAVDADGVISGGITSAAVRTLRRKTGIAAAAVIRLQTRSDGGGTSPTATTRFKYLAVRPVRVG